MGRVSDFGRAHRLSADDYLMVDSQTYGTKKMTVEDFRRYAADVYDYRLSHSLFRGNSLGSSYTAAQQLAVYNGTFDDIYAGDYWTINNRDYYVLGLDSYYHHYSVGSSSTTPTLAQRCTGNHHLVLLRVVDVSWTLGTSWTNMANSDVYSTYLPSIANTAVSDFGTGNILYIPSLLPSNYDTTQISYVKARDIKWSQSALPTLDEIGMGNYFCNYYLNDASSGSGINCSFESGARCVPFPAWHSIYEYITDPGRSGSVPYIITSDTIEYDMGTTIHGFAALDPNGSLTTIKTSFQGAVAVIFTLGGTSS